MRQTLQFRLSAGLVLVIVLLGLAAGIFSYYSAFGEAIELKDDQLRQIALLIKRSHLQIMGQESHPSEQAPDPDTLIVVQ